MLNFGVFVDDLAKIVKVTLRLPFSMPGIFYSIAKRVPKPYGTILLKCNPMANLIDGARNCILYESHPMYDVLGIWFLISIVLCVIGVRLINKYENTYVKVI